MSRHILLTVSGTGTNMWDTTNPQPAGVASALAANNPSLFYWQPVGNYPAATFPMGPSVQDAEDSLTYLATGVPTGNSTSGASYPGNSLILMGYSQGAIAVSRWLRDVAWKNPQIANRVVGVTTWGNPNRLPGFASGNDFAGWPDPADVDGVVTGGISGPDCMTAADVAPHLLTKVTHFWGEYVNTIGDGNDLYADAPVGANPWTAEAIPGTYETQIYNLVQNATASSLFAFVEDIFRLFGAGLFTQTLGILEAILNGGMFAVAGSNAAHYTYDTAPIYNFISLLGSETAPWGPF
jgi:hypothetical protein